MESTKRDHHDSGDEEYKDESFIDKPAVLDKYKAAAAIANEALNKVTKLCVVGADIHAVCQEGDKFMEEELRKVFNNKKSKKLERGIAFPTCVSVNHLFGHYSPLKDESTQLQEGDLAKIDLGCHLDGFMAQAATTVFVTATPDKATDKRAAVAVGGYNAFLAAQRMIKLGATNKSVSETIAKVCEEFGITPVEGALSHKLKKHLIDGSDVILNKETPEKRVETFEFMPGDVFALAVYVSSGEGKTKEGDFRTTVYKRELDQQYNLKIKSARTFFNEMNKKHPTLPFTMAGFDDQLAAKVGVKECLNHDLIGPYPVIVEKNGEFIAHFKCTIAVQQNSTVILCGAQPLEDKFTTDKKITNEDLKTIIEGDLWKKEPKAKKE